MKEREIAVGDRVRLIALPPYLKTAEPMPVLRSANLLQIGDEGTIIDRRPGGYWGVRFAKGAFLLETQYLAK
ncbi:regulatory protein SipA [Myxosarcina sp. GI1(2024)]